MPNAASSTLTPIGPGDAALDRLARRRDVEVHAAAEEGRRVEVAEHEVGVGHRRLAAAEPVARRPGVGARRVRADRHEPERVDPRDRSPSGADLDHVDHGDAHGQPRAALQPVHPVDLELLRDQRLAVLDHAQLRGRAAHVERDQIAHLAGRAEGGGGERAARRARLEQSHREARRHRRHGDAPVREHDVQRPPEPEPGEPPFQIGQVLLDDPLDVDVRDRRRGALELADLGHDLARDRDAQLRGRGAHGLGGALLVAGVREAVQERDRDRLDARAGELARQPRDVLDVDLLLDRPVGERALRHVEAQVARHERPRQIDVEVVDLVAALACDLDRVAVTVGREQRRARALALDDRVGDEGRAVHDPRDVLDRDAVGLERLRRGSSRSRARARGASSASCRPRRARARPRRRGR